RQAGESEDGEGDAVPRFDEILEVLQAFARTGELAAFPRVEVPSRPHPADEVLFEIRFVPPRDLLRRGLDPIRLLDALAELGALERVEPAAATLPPLEALDPEDAHLGFTARLRSREPRSRIEARFDFVVDAAAVEIAVQREPGETDHHAS